MKTDDPQFTAHTLGELDTLTPDERAEIEALLRDDPSAAAEAAETQKVAALLHRNLQGEEMPPLTAAQRARVLAARTSDEPRKITKVVSFPRRTAILSFAAACVIVGAFIAVFAVMNQRHAAAVRLATENSFEAVPEISVPPIESPEAIPDMTFAAPALRPQTDSPTIDVISSTPNSSTASNVAPANAVGTSINSTTLLHIFTGGGTSALPGTMRGRIGSGRASTGDAQMMQNGNASNLNSGALQERTARAGFNAARATEMSEVDTHWARPVRRFDRKTVEVPGSADRLKKSPPDFDTGISEFPDGAFAGRPDLSNSRSFDTITDNAFLPVRENPLSTFSTDVDTASYEIGRASCRERVLTDV